MGPGGGGRGWRTAALAALLALTNSAALFPVADGEAWLEESEVRVPEVLNCDSSPEWRSFRLAATDAVARGFAKSGELEAQAAALEEAWRPWLCGREDGCSRPSELGFDFVRELHHHCRDSNNFERYLVRHYFTNTKTFFEPLQASSGFCLYGYLTALMVLAWHALPERVGESLKYVLTAQHLLGHYHSFDFLESSSWPVTSFLVLVNFHGGQSFLPLLSPPDYGHPGQYGTGWYLDRLRWTGTTEAEKPNPGVAPFLPLPFDALPPGWRGRGQGPERPRITVWQFCIHTSTAGEAATMITRFLSKEYDVVFHGNSIALTLCGNYWPSMCAHGRNAEFLDWLSNRFMENDTPYDELSQRFQSELLPELLQHDVWMCSIPAVWCRLLADASRAEVAPQPHRPVFAYLGLPILQYVGKDDREDFLRSFADLVVDERNLVVANNPYLAEEVLYQTGLRVPTVRIHGLHTNTTWLPLRGDEVLVSRPGTSGGWQECLLRRFLDANPSFPLRFVQFTDLLDPHTTREVYNTSLSYKELAQYRAAVSFPYDTSLMFMWEFYSMNMPLFIPFQLWHWGIFGQHTRPDLEEPTIDAGNYTRPVYSPFFSGFGPLDIERGLFWSKYTDWAMFPHLQYFSGMPELMVKLVRTDLHEVSAAMKRFNEESIVQGVATWRYVVERWLDLEAQHDGPAARPCTTHRHRRADQTLT